MIYYYSPSKNSAGIRIGILDLWRSFGLEPGSNLDSGIILTGLLRQLENLEKSGNLILDQKLREFHHFIQNSGKVREFENFNAGSNFHANFKPNF